LGIFEISESLESWEFIRGLKYQELGITETFGSLDCLELLRPEKISTVWMFFDSIWNCCDFYIYLELYVDCTSTGHSLLLDFVVVTITHVYYSSDSVTNAYITQTRKNI